MVLTAVLALWSLKVPGGSRRVGGPVRWVGPLLPWKHMAVGQSCSTGLAFLLQLFDSLSTILFWLSEVLLYFCVSVSVLFGLVVGLVFWVEEGALLYFPPFSFYWLHNLWCVPSRPQTIWVPNDLTACFSNSLSISYDHQHIIT